MDPPFEGGGGNQTTRAPDEPDESDNSAIRSETESKEATTWDDLGILFPTDISERLCVDEWERETFPSARLTHPSLQIHTDPAKTDLLDPIVRWLKDAPSLPPPLSSSSSIAPLTPHGSLPLCANSEKEKIDEEGNRISGNFFLEIEKE